MLPAADNYFDATCVTGKTWMAGAEPSLLRRSLVWLAARARSQAAAVARRLPPVTSAVMLWP